MRGYNAYLADVGGAKGLSDPRCKGEPWVRPITELDLYRRYFQLGELVSGLIALDGIANAAPVGAAAPASLSAAAPTWCRELGRRKTDLGVGSNAYGLGGDATDNGKGVVLGNPHFPWAGSERLYQSHVTVPGQLDVSGGTLYGVPAVLIGHTKGLAWSHTVATAWRLHAVRAQARARRPVLLPPGRPADEDEGDEADREGEGRRLERARAPSTRPCTGPMFTSLLGLPLFPWTPATGYAMGDVNADNFRYLNHFLETNKAQTRAPVRRHPAPLPGHPVGELAGRRQQGRGLLLDERGDPERAQRRRRSGCQTALGPRRPSASSACPTLDGSRSECEWGEAAGSADKGLLPNARTPSLFRRDYVANGNDSHWLINPRQPLEGFDRIVGIERAEVTPRTRLGLTMIRDRLAGRDGLPGNRFSRGTWSGSRSATASTWASCGATSWSASAAADARSRARPVTCSPRGTARRPRRPGRAAVPALRRPRLPRHRVAAHRHPGLSLSRSSLTMTHTCAGVGESRPASCPH